MVTVCPVPANPEVKALGLTTISSMLLMQYVEFVVNILTLYVPALDAS
jgi:hypothetical protein